MHRKGRLPNSYSFSLLAAFLTLLLTFVGARFVLGQAAPPASPGRVIQVTSGVNVFIPAPWFVAERTAYTLEIVHPLEGERPKVELKPGEKVRLAEGLITTAARMSIGFQQQKTHAEAIKRLSQIASETRERSKLLTIAGWPAIERRRTATLPNLGTAETVASRSLAIFGTTAVALDRLVLRFESVVAPGGNPKLADDAFEIARGIQTKPGNAEAAQHDLNILLRSISVPSMFPQETKPLGPRKKLIGAPAPVPPTPASAAFVQTGYGELEVAASADGKHVVVAANSGFSFSDDGGQTFTFGGGIPCVYNGCDGDPSLAVGKSGSIYFSWMGFPTNEPGSFPPPNGSTDTVSVSTNQGHTFSFAGNAVLCPSKASTICATADQPHIAADRSSLSMAGLDRVYLVFRNRTNTGTSQARIVCSIDGGSTWTAPKPVDPLASGDYPRVAVGGDGSVYVVTINGDTSIMLHKFSTCDNGLVLQASVVVGTYVGGEACGNPPSPAPLPGLDRCNDGNILNSPTVAADPGNPSHISVVWATSTSASNEDILLADSIDGGLTFSNPVRVNSAVTARRFMPWACSIGGVVFASWYDGRASTSANNDLTDYFLGQVSFPSGAPQAGSEVNLSSHPDPQCASGWPCSTFETRDATSCSVQPQLAGFCTSSGARCDFANPTQCLVGEQCSGGGGCPKYGDYNGNTCVEGRIFAAWASATSPPGIAAVNTITIFSTSLSLSPPTCATGQTSCSGVCVNTKTDPNNCGRCGNSCEVGPCTNGTCRGCPAGTHPCDGFCRRICP